LFDLSNYSFSLYALPVLLVGVLVVCLGLASVVRERRSPVSLAFLAMTLSLAVWLFSLGLAYSTGDASVALMWAKASVLGVIFIPAAVFVFTLAVADRLRSMRLLAWASAALSGLFYLGVLFSDWFLIGVDRYFWGYYPRYGPLIVPFLAFFFVLMAVSFRLYWVWQRQTVSRTQRRRLKAMLLALGVAYLGSVDFLATVGIPVYPIGYLFIAAFLALVTRAIWRYRLVDITPASAASQIVDTMADALLVLDRDGVIRVANRAASELFGYAGEDLIGRPAATIDPALHPDRLEQLMQTATVRDHEMIYQRPDSDSRILSLSASVMRDRDDEPLATVCIARDITERKRAEERVRESEALYRTLVETSPDAIILTDRGGTVLMANRRTAELLGYQSAADVRGKKALELVAPEDRQRVTDSLRMTSETGVIRDVEYALLRKDGTPIPAELSVARVLDPAGEAEAIIAVARDITERKWAEGLLAAEKRLLEMVATDAPLSDVLSALARSVEAQSEGMLCSILLLDRDGVHLRDGAAPSLPESYRRAIDGIAIGPSVGSCGTAAYLREPVIATDIAADPLWADYRELALEHGLRACWSTPIFASAGEVLGTFAMYYREPRGPDQRSLELIERVTHIAGIAIERRRAEELVQHLAFHDALTGLANRSLLIDRLSTALAQARRSGQTLAVLFLDLDGLKIVNDTLGHATGDSVLRSVADQLQRLVREADTVAREGGDEFVLLLPAIAEAEDAVEAARRILERLREPTVLEEREFTITGSIGIALYPHDGAEPEALLRSADLAMYRAKERGGNDYQICTPAIHASIVERMDLESDLRRALQEGEFVLHYQPQVDLRTGRVCGVEALLRWQHPERGLVLPAEFIPLAEKTGLIPRLGEWVLRTACAQYKAWQEAGLRCTSVAVNVSPRQLQQPDLIDTVAQVLQETGLGASSLRLEITESAVMRDVEMAVNFLRDLRGMGVEISVDDFGTGYSSLSHLKRLPIDEVKIDRSFVQGVPADLDDAAIVTAIIGLAESLNLRVVAEGVETSEQLAFLKEHGCHIMQGYLFARPVPARGLERFLRRGGRLRSAAA